ncbi:MAG: hypothetical protein ABI781_11495 [Burkholderiales bacterium]
MSPGAAALAPGGRLRASINLGNPILANRDPVTREVAGVSVDLAGVYDLYLTRTLRAAQIERSPTSPTVVDTFIARSADVAAGVKQQLQADAARLGGLRLLPGRFMVIEQAMGLPADRGEAAQAALKAFVEQAKANGFVAQALQRHRIQGAIVAPAAEKV